MKKAHFVNQKNRLVWKNQLGSFPSSLLCVCVCDISCGYSFVCFGWYFSPHSAMLDEQQPLLLLLLYTAAWTCLAGFVCVCVCVYARTMRACVQTAAAAAAAPSNIIICMAIVHWLGLLSVHISQWFYLYAPHIGVYLFVCVMRLRLHFVPGVCLVEIRAAIIPHSWTKIIIVWMWERPIRNINQPFKCSCSDADNESIDWARIHQIIPPNPEKNR